MTIVEKLNEIEEQTKALAYQAQLLEENKRNYEGLLECEVHDHVWKLGGVGSNLRHVQTIHIECERCACYVMLPDGEGETYELGDTPVRVTMPASFSGWQTPIRHHTEVLVRDLIPEEDE
tara:strand:- start:171 stop:530 length:360 start_codon:yes stop_codon:yes gene_type:complete